MALRELKKTGNKNKSTSKLNDEIKAVRFIAAGGNVAPEQNTNVDDHRLTLRIPQWLLDRVDLKRKERVGSISRNLWILEIIEKAVKE